jgi:hypothetical protein
LKNMAKSLLGDTGNKILEQCRANSAGRRGQSAWRSPLRLKKRKAGPSIYARLMQRDRKHCAGRMVKKLTTVYCCKCDTGPRCGDSFKNLHTKANIGSNILRWTTVQNLDPLLKW